MKRRDFLKSSAATAAVPLLASPLFATNNKILKVGLIGCGGRGKGAAFDALRADANTQLYAMCDVFEDRLESGFQDIHNFVNSEDADLAADRMDVPKERRFSGFDGYKELLDSGVDVVILATTPGFRPEHLAAAVDAGKDIFTEKPVAVDAPGIRSVLETAKKASEKGLRIAHGFCWRSHFGKQAIYEKINQGAIGDVRLAYATYLAGGVWSRSTNESMSEQERQLRNWYYYTYLSGDHIVEQAVHSVDKLLWAFGDRTPEFAIALGGRQARTEAKYGNIFDHFSVVYEYADGAQAHLLTRQQSGTAGENLDRVLGADGIAWIDGWANKFRIEGKNPWEYSGPSNNMYQTEHDTFFAALRAGKDYNQLEAAAQSTMAAILGRMASYSGKRLTWEKALASEERLLPEKWGWGDAPMRPVAIPGRS
jgi:myo-inositol 2-dehydrogenase/D-chiro-inositol 1-dehydrogenase